MLEYVYRTLYRDRRQAVWAAVVLTVFSGVLGMAVLAYINSRLLNGSGGLWPFALLVLLYFAASTLAQVKLSHTGHGFICTMQTQLVKQIMDADVTAVRQAGKAEILAALSNDVRTLSIAFTRLPEWVQGVLTVGVCSLYVVWLSPKLFAVVAAMMAVMVAGGHVAVNRHYRAFRNMRASEDGIYRHYETVLDGHKELLLNRHRAERFFRQEFSPEADGRRRFHIAADVWHFTAVNWGNAVMLAAVGAVFYCAVYFGWASAADAAVTAMAVLFMRGPLAAAVGSFPVMMQAAVALQSLARLGLPEYREGFHGEGQMPSEWRQIRFENVVYAHPEQGGRVFALEPVNLTLARGETVFLIGANGSGKSTLLMLLCGLYAPSGGRIYVDDVEITEANRPAYRRLFSAVFTDFHLFARLADGLGRDVSDGLIEEWLARLALTGKAEIEAGRLLTDKLSQGQRKRLALMSAVLEQRSMLVLDEWAADQDPQFRRIFYEELLPLLKARGHTVFAISHDDKYFGRADRILSMEQGVLGGYGQSA